ncbi:putative trehalose-phosphate phosphatase D [Rosa sericea]
MTNFAKLNQAMGFQRSSTSDKQKVQPISTKVVKNDENSGDLSLASIASNRHDISTIVNTPIPSSDIAYSSWVVEHPSALGSFDRMMKAAKGKRIVVFLDYDGTLSPIVDDPDRAFMSNEMRAAVREVAKYFPTAVISGRSRDKVKGFVQLSNVYYAGSHGMDIMVPPKPLKPCDAKNHVTATASALDKEGDMLFQPAKRFLPAIQEISIVLEEIARKIEGARVEDNRFCISVHYRKVREEDYGILEEKVKSVIENYPDFHLTRGKKVLEIRPSIEWNKGHALEYLLDTLGFSNSGDVLPLYIGDDRTDEDAFKVIEARGQGFPIIVSSIPKDTKAAFSLHDPSEVLTFLLRLARWRKASSSSRSLAQIWGLGNSHKANC